MLLTDRKLEARINEIKGYRYRDILPLEAFLCKEDTQTAVNPVLPVNFEGWDTLWAGEVWKGRDLYLWLHKYATLPAEWSGKRIVGLFDFGNTGAGNNSGFESLLYINGQPYQGVDVNHQEVFFKEEMCGKTLDLTFRLWSGFEGGGIPKEQEHRINRCDLAWLDEETDDFYYTGLMVVQTILILEEQNPVRQKLRSALNQALKLVDWSYGGSEAFYQSIQEAGCFLNQELDRMGKDSLVSVKCVGHTHIDVAWLWRLKNTREKCSRSFSTVLRLMEQYPEYIFLQTQPQLYEYIKTDFPDIYEKIKERVLEGRWEANGGMWVEADCNLTSGESLTRQFLIGSGFFEKEFGIRAEYLWLPDVFGYSWALPQILKKCGIDLFMTTKISWNQYNRMPHDTFRWIGIDGSEVLTHFITTPEPHGEPGSWFYTYNGQLLPKTVKGVWDAYSEKDMNQELLISYGYGDGGGGVNRDTLEQRRRIDKIPGLPSLKPSTATDYFNTLKQTVKDTGEFVPSWDGELYLEYHRGTYTSQGYNKMTNRKMEFLYRETEWLSAAAAICGGGIETACQNDLTKGWKIVLTHQFHDIIPGSSIHEVYEDSRENYKEAAAIADKVRNAALTSLLEEEENTYTVINNSGWLRKEAVWLRVSGQKIFKDAMGTKLSAQQAPDGYWVQTADVPPMGFAVITAENGSGDAPEEKLLSLSESEHPSCYLENRQTKVETPFYTLFLNDHGQISYLYDKDNDVCVLPEGERANVLQIFEDKPLGNDAWDIDIFYQEKMQEVTGLRSICITENGALRAVLSLEWSYRNTLIRQDMIFYKDSKRIDFKTYVDWHEKQQLLKAAFPVDIRSTYATYDIQYGNVKRPNHWNTSWDTAKFETVAHRFVDLSESNYGVSLLNNGKYGHDVKGNVMRISLIKSAVHPDHLQDQGEHEFTYSLLPHKGDFLAGECPQEAYALNQPLIAVSGRISKMKESFLSVDNAYIEIDAIKQSETGDLLVVRFHEFSGGKQPLCLRFGFPVAAYAECDLMERPVEEFIQADASFTGIHTIAKPYEIKTYLIRPI